MPGKVTFNVTGVRELVAKAKKAAEVTTAAGGIALYAVGNNIAVGSQQRTPVDTGNLRGSHYVTHPQKDGKSGINVEIGVGTTAESYAIEQHENTAFRHEEGEDHFMWKSIQAELPTMPELLKAFMKQALESGQANQSVPSLVPDVPTSGLGSSEPKEAHKPTSTSGGPTRPRRPGPPRGPDGRFRSSKK